MFAFGSKYLSMKSSGAILIEQCESVLFHGTVKDAPAYHERSNHAQYDPIMCACVCVCASIPARCAAGQQLPRLRQRAGLSEKEKKKVPRWHVLIMSLH